MELVIKSVQAHVDIDLIRMNREHEINISAAEVVKEVAASPMAG